MKKDSTQWGVVRYYSRFGSRVGYNLVMRGSKHFGYYDNQHTTEESAQANYLTKALELIDADSSMQVLDAGSGQGVIAVEVAKQTGAYVTGITLVPFEVRASFERAAKAEVTHKVSFVQGDYAYSPFPKAHFDRIYAVETLSHAPDVAHVINEFSKLLKPGGKLICLEYEADYKSMSTEELANLDYLEKYGALYGVRQFQKGRLAKTIQKAGLTVRTEQDWTPHVLPSFRRLRRLAAPFVPIIKTLRLERFSINTVAARMYADGAEHNKLFYTAIVAEKPKNKTAPKK